MSRLVTFNCHEAYVHLLGKLGFELDIIDCLSGRYTSSWDTRMRPVPDNARLISLPEALNNRYDLAITHNVTDLLQLRELHIPKILILHVSLQARALEERSWRSLAMMQSQLSDYVQAIGATPIAVSQMKANSWGLDCPIIRPCASPDEYYGYTGELPEALRVANQVGARKERFAWQEHGEIVRDLPFRLVGHNPDIANCTAADNWQQLRTFYRQHRVYVHTAGPALDDGYNMGIVEAMTTGMPVVSLAGSETPLVSGLNGYVGDNTTTLHEYLAHLLKNRRVAIEMGKRARETAVREFSVRNFVEGWHSAIEIACRRFSLAS